MRAFSPQEGSPMLQILANYRSHPVQQSSSRAMELKCNMTTTLLPAGKQHVVRAPMRLNKLPVLPASRHRSTNDCRLFSQSKSEPGRRLSTKTARESENYSLRRAHSYVSQHNAPSSSLGGLASSIRSPQLAAPN